MAYEEKTFLERVEQKGVCDVGWKENPWKDLTKTNTSNICARELPMSRRRTQESTTNSIATKHRGQPRQSDASIYGYHPMIPIKSDLDRLSATLPFGSIFFLSISKVKKEHIEMSA
uniref:Uncharacterized protein n=1 Tax=Vespula pensylvanica TaxID=30213 RepID=A0A834U7A3_VESPE|nr:hypothetical protein H0235_010063 [Vespula pensylvanica]